MKERTKRKFLKDDNAMNN